VLKRELLFFVINGLVSVTIAYGVYLQLMAVGLLVELASGLAYFAGMIYGFFANKCLTFRDERKNSTTAKIARYVLLHIGTLLLNVQVNSFLLGVLRGLSLDFFIAFISAIGISTIINYIGMKYWIFTKVGISNETSNKGDLE